MYYYYYIIYSEIKFATNTCNRCLMYALSNYVKVNPEAVLVFAETLIQHVQVARDSSYNIQISGPVNSANGVISGIG